MSNEQAKTQVSTSAIIADLTNGLNRKDIAAKYGTSVAQVNRWFKHPSLKGLRPKGKSDFELVIDTPAVERKEKKAAPAAEVSETDGI